MATRKTPEVSVVIATYNRGPALCALLDDLAAQTLPRGSFEVIVVDDGSEEPAKKYVQQAGTQPYRMTLERQQNAGPAVARNRGVRLAKGRVVVITDDDMRIGPDFLERHLSEHQRGADVVLGYIAAPEGWEDLPVYERFHAAQLERFADGAATGAIDIRGVHVCTGNVSFRRDDFLRLGGFDESLGHSEDREMGLSFEEDGLKLVFSQQAKVSHESDRASAQGWLDRSFKYGVFDSRIAKRHPTTENADPWRFLFRINLVTRPVALAVVAFPPVGEALAHLGLNVAYACEGWSLERWAQRAVTFAYGMQYFRGLRSEVSSPGEAFSDLGWYIAKRRRAKLPTGKLQAITSFAHSVREDFRSVQRYRKKYHGQEISLAALPPSIVKKIGLQMLVSVRAMQFARDAKLPLVPAVLSRLIRHTYGAEIHWETDVQAGISVVHGVGLVLSHRATVEPGCILFQNVTLGEGIDPETREVGAPTLRRDVHVGPGATLLGPIEIGEGSKIMAGAVVTRSVPPHSVVRPAPIECVEREAPPVEPVRRTMSTTKKVRKKAAKKSKGTKKKVNKKKVNKKKAAKKTGKRTSKKAPRKTTKKAKPRRKASRS